MSQLCYLHDLGGYQEGGRGMSIWDTFSHEKGRTDKGDTGDVAVNFYHRYQEVRIWLPWSPCLYLASH